MRLCRRRVQPVLEHVEVKPAQIVHAEVVHALVDQVELVIAVGRDDLLLQRAVRRSAQASRSTS